MRHAVSLPLRGRCPEGADEVSQRDTTSFFCGRAMLAPTRDFQTFP